MFGLLCTDNLELVGHSMFTNYRYALYNYFKESMFKDVKNIVDLENITHLFIIDEHFRYNLAIWGNGEFINRLNERNIRVIIFNSEKIYNNNFPWNVQIQEKVQSIVNKHQFVCDIDEAKLFDKKVINKFFISKTMDFHIEKNNKLEKILFIGQIDGEQYRVRRETLEAIRKIGFPLEIINSQRKVPYRGILNLYNNYRYVLCPIGTGKWISYRHYEVTHLGSIPIQQITDDMEDWFSELKSTSIFFKDVSEIRRKINEFRITGEEILLEDYFEGINLRSYL